MRSLRALLPRPCSCILGLATVPQGKRRPHAGDRTAAEEHPRGRQRPAGRVGRGRTVSARAGRLDRRAARRSKSARASGYSAIWIGLGLRETGGRLTTIEYDPVRAKEAADNIRRAGLQDVVRVIPGDAFKQIPTVAGTFDFVFLDAWKPDYKKFFDLVFPRVTPGGLFLAHNVDQQEKRDARFPRRHRRPSAGLHDHRVRRDTREFR